jgi:hypothetical protein
MFSIEIMDLRVCGHKLHRGEHGDVTEVVVMHEQIVDIPTRKRHELGWHGCLDGLANYLKE